MGPLTRGADEGEQGVALISPADLTPLPPRPRLRRMSATPILIAQHERSRIHLLPQMANRHGLIAGATGTGKTVTLQRLAEGFSSLGVPVFLADVKGDLAGLSQPGGQSPKVQERVLQLGIEDFTPAGCPVTCWDIFGEKGHPVRATISEMGPLMLARLLQLNDTQAGVLQILFRLADENGLLLLDLKDLRAMAQYVGEQAGEFTTRYGNVSAASVGAIQRTLLNLEAQGGERFFAEPALNFDDLLQTAGGRGVVNILAADKLLQSPLIYSTALLWMLSELFERLPEVGDLPQPKLVFFFDEAHLLFKDAPASLLDKIEQVVRLVGSKGVGVFFITQNPRDIPDAVLGQLGNRIQHGLRAFTPRDQKAVAAAAQTFRVNPALNTEEAILALGVGEALLSLLDERGQPAVVERAWIVPPQSQLGPITDAQRSTLIQQSLVAGVYEQVVDRDSAYEHLVKAHTVAPATAPRATTPGVPVPPTVPGATGGGGFLSGLLGAIFGKTSARGDSLAAAASKSVVRTLSSTLTREITRGLLGSMRGGRRR
jgi:DNA helicase HerA-like ATPase